MVPPLPGNRAQLTSNLVAAMRKVSVKPRESRYQGSDRGRSGFTEVWGVYLSQDNQHNQAVLMPQTQEKFMCSHWDDNRIQEPGNNVEQTDVFP